MTLVRVLIVALKKSREGEKRAKNAAKWTVQHPTNVVKMYGPLFWYKMKESLCLRKQEAVWFLLIYLFNIHNHSDT